MEELYCTALCNFKKSDMAWCTFCGLFPLSSNDYEESNEISNVNSFYEYDPESGLSNSQSMSMSNDPSDVRDGKLKKKKSQYKEQCKEIYLSCFN